jgi:hypothetical protein
MDWPKLDFFSLFDLLAVRVFLSILLVIELFKVIKGRLKRPPR